jgi:endonuclease/exonuclease/phosphatase family metal-dependent hydrolase
MRLLCWNVQWCRGIDGKVDPARIAAEARRLADPDVICLQEVAAGYRELPGSAGEDQFELLAEEFRGYAACAVCPVDTPGRRFGNLLLSRLPVARVLRHSLPWPPAPDVPSMPRAAVEAVVEAPFGALRILTTHLEYYSAEHRAAQVGRLRAIHAEACSGRKPVSDAGPFRLDGPLPQSALLCGDFNFRHDDPLHERLIHAGLVDAWNVAHFGAPRAPTSRVHQRDPGEEPYCCDYVFLTDDLVPRLRSMRIDAGNRASDHQPLIVELW